jgi:hypothetical protein
MCWLGGIDRRVGWNSARASTISVLVGSDLADRLRHLSYKSLWPL